MESAAAPAALASLPLPDSLRVFRTQVPDEARQRVAAVFCDHALRVLDHGRELDATMHYLRAGGVGVGTMTYGASVAIEADSLGDFLLVQMPRRGRELVHHAGVTVHSDARVATVVGHRGRLRMQHEAGTEKVFLRIDKDMLERRCRQQLGGDLRAPLEFSPRMPLDCPRSASWVRMVRWLYDEACASAEGRGNLFDSPLFAAHAEQMVVTALLLCQPHNYSERLESGAAHAAPAAIRRAERYIEEHAHEPVTVDDVAEAAGLGTRALFVNFRRHRGTSPMHHLKCVRLDRVHAHLLASDPRATTVTAVAMQWGFAHLGHFTSAFRERFGELPSAVLTR